MFFLEPIDGDIHIKLRGVNETATILILRKAGYLARVVVPEAAREDRMFKMLPFDPDGRVRVV